MRRTKIESNFRKEAEEYFDLKFNHFLREHATDFEEVKLNFWLVELKSSSYSCVCKVLLQGSIYGEPYKKQMTTSRSPWGEVLFFFVPGTLFISIFMSIANFLTRNTKGREKEANFVFQCVDKVTDKFAITLIRKIDTAPSYAVKFWRSLFPIFWLSTFAYFIGMIYFFMSWRQGPPGMFWSDLIGNAAISFLLSLIWFRAMTCIAPLSMENSFFRDEPDGQIYFKLSSFSSILLMKFVCLGGFFTCIGICCIPFMILR